MDSNNIGNFRWKIILPAVFLIFLLAQIDRTNISFAMSGMEKTFAVTSAITGFISGIFFIGYVMLMGPMGHLASRRSPRFIILVLGILTGIFSTAQGLAPNITVLVVVRFLLGLAEGGMLPTITVLVANWFPQHERGRAMGLFYMYGPISAIIMSPISGFTVANAQGMGLEGWRWLLISQGLPVVLIAVFFYLLVPDSPDKASTSRLGKAEREYLTNEMKIEAQKPKITKDNSYRKAIFTANFLLMAFAYFCAGGIGNWGITMWIPEIIKQFSSYGFTAVGFIATIPWAIVALTCAIVGFVNDKFKNRKKAVLLGLYIIATVCLFTGTSIIRENLWIAIIAIGVSAGTGIAASSVFITFLQEVYPKNMLGGMMGIWNSLGMLGGFFGPFIVGALMSGSTNKLNGVLFLGVCYFVATICVTLLRIPKGMEVKNAVAAVNEA